MIEEFLDNPELLKKVNEWFGKTSSVKSVFEVEDQGEFKKLLVRDLSKKTQPRINIVDAGSGLRQILPIIAVSLQDPHNDSEDKTRGTWSHTVALEEPEANLHPSFKLIWQNLLPRMLQILRITIISSRPTASI